MVDTKMEIRTMEHAAKVCVVTGLVVTVAACATIIAAEVPLAEAMPWSLMAVGVWAAAFAAYVGALAVRDRGRMVAGMALTVAAFAAAYVGISIGWLGLV